VFTSDKGAQVLVATDAAGEGLNLQRAHLMVNYDLPWNPNRIEQRFGRIHRIGQIEVCRLWNLVADDTREGAVFLRLLDKMEEQRRAYKGKVFDVLGETFEGRPLRELLIEAIRNGDQPVVLGQMSRQQHRPLGSELLDHLPRLEPLPRIETDRWLVQDQDARIVNDTSGQRDPLTLPTAEGADPPRRQVQDLHHAQGSLHRRVRPRCLHPAQPGCVGDQVAHLHQTRK
jgi:superfamily II DNA/RNA helicase